LAAQRAVSHKNEEARQWRMTKLWQSAFGPRWEVARGRRKRDRRRRSWFMRDGKMFVGVMKDDLLVRVEPERRAGY
jgi:hypothetical protein